MPRVIFTHKNAANSVGLCPRKTALKNARRKRAIDDVLWGFFYAVDPDNRSYAIRCLGMVGIRSSKNLNECIVRRILHNAVCGLKTKSLRSSIDIPKELLLTVFAKEHAYLLYVGEGHADVDSKKRRIH